MPDHGDWQFEIEIHPEQWRFSAGRSWIAGWLHSRSGRVAGDVRAWIDDQPFLGLCGLPRPEIERRFHGREGPPHAGFSFLLEPHRHARLLRVEACDLRGAWEEIHRQGIDVAREAAEMTAAAPLGGEISDLLISLLRAKHNRSDASWSGLAGEVLAAHRAVPLNTLPNPPFHGALEEPTGTGRVKYGRMTITGWLAHRERMVTRLTAFTDPLQPVPLLYGLPRRDVSSLFAGLRNAEHSQFTGHVDVPSGLPQPVSLRIFAELDDGHRELVFNQRFKPQIVTGAEPLLPRFSRLTFLRAAGALHVAVRQHHLQTGLWRERLSALRAAWDAYRAEAPARSPATPRRYVAPASDILRQPLKVVLLTHNLNLEGAPLFAYEYARHLAAQPGWQVRVVSPQDGPLRQKFEATGLPVEIVEVQPLLGARTLAEFDGALAALAAHLDWSQADLIVANTMVAFWAVHVARRLHKPSVLYIHESAAVRRFFAPLLAPALVRRAEEAFSHASRVVFIAAATQAVHARLERRGNFQYLPSWIDVARIEQFCAGHDRQALRRQHGLAADAVILVNVGSVCERKGQHIFIQAIDLLARELAERGPGSSPRQFLMVGARPGAYLDALRHEIALRGLTNAILIDETAAPYDFYRLSDIFVCSSFEESFPRVLMEAAAFGLPIVSTNVNGVTEMLGADDAWLVPPGDAGRLAGAMRAALDAHLAGDRTRAERARRLVLERFDARRTLPLHAALAAETTARSRT